MRLYPILQVKQFVATIFNVVVVATIYLVLGYLGINFAGASGYASPIFPAAGFAIAMTLWSDRRALLGVWIGAFTLNVGIAWLHGNVSWAGILGATGIACGAAMQAFVAWWLVVSRVGNGWRTLEAERDIIYCLALAGPIAGLVSASVGVTTLFGVGIIPGAEYWIAWLSWWSGDVLGIVTTLPICLTFLFRHQKPWASRMTTLAMPMLLTLGVVGDAFYEVTQWERKEQKLFIQSHGAALANLLKQRFIAHQEVLAALHRLIEVTPEMNYHQFEYFTKISLQKNPDIFALSFNPFITLAQRDQFERAMTEKNRNRQFQITERDEYKRLVRAAERPYYVPVGYIAPLQGNQPAVGFDINSESVRHDAIERAMIADQVVVTAPINLVQENQQRVGVLLLHKTKLARTENFSITNNSELIGFATAVVKVDEMVEIAIRSALIPGLVFQVNDSFAASDLTSIYRSENLPTSSDSYYNWETRIPVADRFWTLRLLPSEVYLRQQQHWAALLVGTGGLSLAALLQLLLLVTTGRASIFQSKVRKQTAELQNQTDILEDRNQQLNALFALSPDGFITFDKQGRVTFASPAFTALSGLRDTQIIGLNEEEFSTRLAELCDVSARFCGIEALRRRLAEYDKQHRELIELSNPISRVLQVGIRVNESDSGTVSQILYFRDVTHESKVDRMKSEFLATAAHELRTPMASIFGFSEVLLTMDLDETTRRELVSIIHSQSEMMANIINELLDLARIEARRGKDFVCEHLAINELLLEMVSNYKEPDGRASPLLKLSAQQLYINVDRSKTLQALTNLVSNAYKYSPNGGEVNIAILQEKTNEGRIRCGISVRDYGIGMTPEQCMLATERFYRADESGKILGTGLGLSIVKEIVELQGGEISIKSDFGAGTTATLWFPMVVNT